MAGLNARYTSIKRVFKETIVCCKHSYKRNCSAIWLQS